MTEKKPRGRQIHVEMPADEYDSFRALARKQDLSLQQLARRCIRAYMEHGDAYKDTNSNLITYKPRPEPEASKPGLSKTKIDAILSTLDAEKVAEAKKWNIDLDEAVFNAISSRYELVVCHDSTTHKNIGANGMVEFIVQVNGKVYGSFEAPPEASINSIVASTFSAFNHKLLDGNPVQKIVIVPGRMVNVIARLPKLN